MPLVAGQSLSFYEILGPLGAGAMGEVYRAKDTRLEREVAIKVLPEHFAEDEERLRRFEREAKSLASLNHPNVAQIFGVDQVEDTCFLVLELVPGETLEDRIARSALPIDEAVDVCRQIADGLEAAHAAGVIHRDLKPANVRITPDGKVKLLDFGLAKPTGPENAESSTGDSVLATEAGRLLGTPVYMAPEQARGRPIDRRVDLWAFGCLLYECLTGKRAFTGESVTDVLASVLHSEPDWAALPAATPAYVRRVLVRCLAKDAARRLRDAGDAGLMLASPTEELGTDARPDAGRARQLAVLMAVGLAIGVAIGFLARGPASVATPEADTLLASLPLPAGTALAPEGGPPAVSPDGSRVAFVALDGRGDFTLWVRSLEDGETVQLPGTSGATYPFWSPDGRRLAFSRGRELLTMGIDESRPQLLVEVDTTVTGGSWNEQNQILYAVRLGPLMLIDARGGQPRVALDHSPGSRSCWGMWPSFLPGGRCFVFAIQDTSGEASGLFAGELGFPEKHLLLPELTNAVFVDPGWLVHRRGDAIYATAFDPATMQLGDESVRIAMDVVLSGWPMHARFGASRVGRLIYQRRDSALGISELVWFDPEEGTAESLDCRGSLWNPRLSHGGTKLALDRSSLRTSGDVWVRDLVRGSEVQLTDVPSDDSWPLWSPDDREVYFYLGPHLHVANASGVGGAELVLENATPLDLTSDGRSLLYRSPQGEGKTILGLLDLETNETTEILSDVNSARVSPDGSWMAVSVQIGDRRAVGVAAFPDGSDLTLVPAEWAERPVWSVDGREILYSTRREILAAPVALTPGQPPVVGAPRVLLSLAETQDHYLLRRGFDVSHDGKRLLLIRSLISMGQDSLTLLENGIPNRKRRAQAAKKP